MLLIDGTTLRQEALRERLKLLTEEKCDLQTQLMDCHLRIEQEGKVQFAAPGPGEQDLQEKVTRSASFVLLFFRQAALHFSR